MIGAAKEAIDKVGGSRDGITLMSVTVMEPVAKELVVAASACWYWICRWNISI